MTLHWDTSGFLERGKVSREYERRYIHYVNTLSVLLLPQLRQSIDITTLGSDVHRLMNIVPQYKPQRYKYILYEINTVTDNHRLLTG